MERPCSVTSLKPAQNFLVKPDFLMKCNLEKGKGVRDEPQQRNNLESGSPSAELPENTVGIGENPQIIDPADKGKAVLDQEAQKVVPKPEIIIIKDEPEPTVIGESSAAPPLSPPSVARFPRRPIACKYCGQKFPTTQALGGHQNAHRQERELQKAMKAAHDLGRNQILQSLPRTAPPPLYGSHPGHRYHYHPYNAYAPRAFQARPAYAHPQLGLAGGPTGLGRALEEFVGPSSATPVGTPFNPGWPTPYACPTGSIRRSNELTNFDPVLDPNLPAFLQGMENEAELRKNRFMALATPGLKSFYPFESSNSKAYLQARENEASLARKESMESSGPSLSLNLNCNEPAKMKSPMECDSSSKQNESTKLDLTLKL